MAVGFTPKHIQVLSLSDLTQPQFVALSHETVTQLGWKVGHLSGNGLIAYTDNGVLSWNAEVKVKIENGSVSVQSTSTGGEIMDWGKNKNNVGRFIAKLESVKQSLTKEVLDTQYLELTTRFPQGEDILTAPPATTTEKITGFFSIFIPKEGFFVTPILIDVNLLIFILMAVTGVNIFLPDNESLLNWGANFRPITLEGQSWRLLTNCFLHIGIIHLLMNMYALLYIGVLLEPHLGRSRFISAYLLTGITASVASLWWHDLTISAGASGAIFGMYGVFLAMLTTNLIEKTARKTLLTSIGVFVGYNLIYGLKGGIDNAAHIGGLLGGLVVGYSFIPSLKKPAENNLKLATIGILSAFILSSSLVVYRNLPNDIGTYDARIKEFASLESMALHVYNLPSDTPPDTILYEIKDKGIYYWNENIKLIDSFQDLDLPLEIRTRNRLLREYCELRIKSYELLYKAISEDTDEYQTQLADYNRLIEEKIKELGGE